MSDTPRGLRRSDLDRARLERLEQKVDELLAIVKAAPVAPLTSTPQTYDCGCPQNGYVCNNAYCPRAPRVIG